MSEQRIIMSEKAAALYNEALQVLRRGEPVPDTVTEGLKTELNTLKAALLQRERLFTKLMSSNQKIRTRPEDLGGVVAEIRMRAAGVRLLEEMLLKINGQMRRCEEVEGL